MNKLQQKELYDKILAASNVVINSTWLGKPVYPEQHHKDLLIDLGTTEKFKVYIDPNEQNDGKATESN